MCEAARFDHLHCYAYAAGHRQRAQAERYLRDARDRCDCCAKRARYQSYRADSRDFDSRQHMIGDFARLVFFVGGLELDPRPWVRPQFEVVVVPAPSITAPWPVRANNFSILSIRHRAGCFVVPVIQPHGATEQLIVGSWRRRRCPRAGQGLRRVL